jgi:hypothetical protein
MRRPLATQRTAPDPTGWAGQRAPRGRERHHTPVRPDPRGRTLDPYIHTSPEPPGWVRTPAGSRNEKDPSVCRGPALTRVRALPSTSRSGGNPLLVTPDISYRAEPDEKSCRPCIYWGKDAPPATTLTGDVPSQHLMWPVPSADRRRQGHPTGGAPAGSTGKQCAHAGRRTILTFCSARSFPCTPRIRRPRATGHGKIVSATDIRGSKLYILYVPGPTCRGPILFVHAPFSYKRGGIRCYRGQTQL